MKKIIALATALILSTFSYGQSIKLTIGFTPTVLINTGDKKESAPSPVIYPVSFGCMVPVKNLYFTPRLSFFTNYYLLTKDGALPAEIENRTATALNFLIDLPFTYNKSKDKHNLEVGGGPALLFRYGILSNGVDKSDAGYKGSAEEDVKEINKDFYKNVGFLYLNGNIAYLYQLTDRIEIGPELRFYYPISSIIDNKPMHGSMIGLGVKTRF